MLNLGQNFFTVRGRLCNSLYLFLRIIRCVIRRIHVRRGETTLPLAQGTTADGNVSLGIITRLDIPSPVSNCHRRILHVNIYIRFAIIFIIRRAIKKPPLDRALLRYPFVSRLTATLTCFTSFSRISATYLLHFALSNKCIGNATYPD